MDYIGKKRVKTLKEVQQLDYIVENQVKTVKEVQQMDYIGENRAAMVEEVQQLDCRPILFPQREYPKYLHWQKSASLLQREYSE